MINEKLETNKSNANNVGAGPVSALKNRETNAIVGVDALIDPQNNHAITLIALIITIIILLILAGVTISLILGDNGLIKSTKEANEKYSEQEERERLDIALNDLKIKKYADNQYNTRDYITNYLENLGFTVDDDIITVDKYQFKIDKEELLIVDNLGIASQENLLKPKISKIIGTPIGTSINTEIILKKGDNVKYTYIIQEEGEDTIIEKIETTDNTKYIFKNLTYGKTYKITVIAKNEYGEEINKITVKIISIKELTEGMARFKVEPLTKWQKEVRVTIESEYNDNGTILQYKKGGNGEWMNYQEEGIIVDKNDKIYGRFYDEIANEEGYNFDVIIDNVDSTAPTVNIVLSTTSTYVNKTITATVTFTDTESGVSLENCKYQWTTTATNLGEDATKYSGTFEVNGEKLTKNTGSLKSDLYLHVLSCDNFGNMHEQVSSKVEVIYSSTLSTSNWSRSGWKAPSTGSTAYKSIYKNTTAWTYNSSRIDLSNVKKVKLTMKVQGYYSTTSGSCTVRLSIGTSSGSVAEGVEQVGSDVKIDKSKSGTYSAEVYVSSLTRFLLHYCEVYKRYWTRFYIE